eukprot:TRINITY_DN755_c0_g1_i2.p1 TRINITY_DN755_c0_g1~~TRINITY_DN755_c0_g1_i2.p1  ORF type:complete len:873 (+),score=187.93 TRINITY_DN755_c0_g1_i2:1969-4587(+)
MNLTEQVFPEETPEETEKRENHMWNLIQETLYTEKSYVKSLRQLVSGEESYYQMLYSFASENHLDLLLLDTIFGSLHPILALQEKLLAELQLAVDSWKKEKRFGAVFSKFKDEFSIYAEFAMLKSENQQALAKMATEGSPYFEKFSVATAGDPPHPFFMGLNNSYITPIQRLPRYTLLLADLVKNSRPKDADYKALCQAQYDLKTVTKRINEEVARAQLDKMTEKFKHHKVFSSLGEDGERLDIVLIDFIVFSFLWDISGKVQERQETTILVLEHWLAAPDLEQFIPAPLYWITPDVKPETLQEYKIVYEEHELPFFHEIRGPTTRWIVKHANTPEFEGFCKKLMGTIDVNHLDIPEMSQGRRFGACDFNNGTFYDGSFYNAKVGGGEGEMITADESSSFMGYWDNENFLGYGRMKKGNDISESAWTYENTKGKLSVTVCPPESLKWTSQKPTDADWDAIFMNKIVLRANAGECFIQQGKPALFFMRIRVGCVKVIRESPEGDRKVLFHAFANDVIGLSAFFTSTYTYTALVLNEPAEAYVVSMEELQKGLKDNPMVALRLYCFLERHLIEKIKSLSSKKAADLPEVIKLKATTMNEAAQKKLVSKHQELLKVYGKKHSKKKVANVFDAFEDVMKVNTRVKGDLTFYPLYFHFTSGINKEKLEYSKLDTLHIQDDILILSSKGKEWQLKFQNTFDLMKAHLICNRFRTMHTNKLKPALTADRDYFLYTIAGFEELRSGKPLEKISVIHEEFQKTWLPWLISKSPHQTLSKNSSVVTASTDATFCVYSPEMEGLKILHGETNIGEIPPRVLFGTFALSLGYRNEPFNVNTNKKMKIFTVSHDLIRVAAEKYGCQFCASFMKQSLDILFQVFEK